MNKYDFNDLAAMLRNGASDEEIAKAFSENLNLAKAEEAKRKAEEEKKAAAEAAKAEDARLHRNKSMQLAADAAAALNTFLIHENVLHEGNVCFTAEDLIDTIDEVRKESKNICALIDSFGNLLGSETKYKDSSPVKTSDSKLKTSDDDIFAELFYSLFK